MSDNIKIKDLNKYLLEIKIHNINAKLNFHPQKNCKIVLHVTSYGIKCIIYFKFNYLNRNY